MEHIQLIEFLSAEADDLLQRSQGATQDDAQAHLDEAVELLALSASLLKKHSQELKTEELRSAA